MSIKVQDNGVGFPRNKSKLIEPYVSNKAKGTGLGLAIVNKVISDHEGYLEFTDLFDAAKKTLNGAEIKLLVPIVK